MSATQRSKGQRGEREFCAALRDHLGEALTRQLGSARDGGPDLLIGETWAVEIKRGERLRLADWWQQACAQAADCYRWPALAYRPNRQPWRVSFSGSTLSFIGNKLDSGDSGIAVLHIECSLAGLAREWRLAADKKTLLVQVEDSDEPV